ncbi:MAG: protein kinase [Deltaproteobacteria bacterium]
MSAKVLRRLKRGSLCEILEARYVEPDGVERPVVVKRLLKKHTKDARARVSLAEEARLCAVLDHPNIVSFLDSGEADDRPYLVLERIDGLDLADIAAQTSIPREVALHIAAEILRALGYVHALTDEDDNPLNIVHRDVTPGNVLVSWNGDVKLTDFGIAQQVERADVTLAGHHKGTVAFMSPEQSRGDGCDRRADLFAMGCLLQWMLVGESPLDSPQARRAVFAGEDAVVAESLSDDVATIVRRATRGAREERYTNAAAMGVHIASVFVDDGVTDPRGRLRRFMRKLRAASAVAAPQAMRDLFDPSLLGESPEVSFDDQTHLVEEDLATDAAQTDRAEVPIAATVPTAIPVDTGPTMAPAGPTVATAAPVDMISPGQDLAAAPTVAQRPVAIGEADASSPRLASWSLPSGESSAASAPSGPVDPLPTDASLENDTDPVTTGGQQTELELQLRSDAGRVIHGYRLTDRIARGSKSTLYAAVHETLGFEYCVRIVARRPHDLQEAERIRDNAQRVGRLRVPHVAPVIDFGFLDDGRPFSTMARIDGATLADYVGRSIPWPQLRLWVLDLARALSAAHSAGVVHGDVELSNVIVVAEEPRLVGFDIAQPDGVTPEDDVFGLGWIASYLLDGSPPESFPPEAAAPEAFRELVYRMCDEQEGRRPKLSEVISTLESLPSAPRDPASIVPKLTEAPAAPTQVGQLVEQSAVIERAGPPWGWLLLFIALATVAGVVTFEILA